VEPFLERFRARTEMHSTHPERRLEGLALLDELRSLAKEIERVIPELTALTRYASRPDAATLSVGWRSPQYTPSEAPRLALSIRKDGLGVWWGFGQAGTSRERRERHIVEAARKRRAHAEALTYRLGALRSEGAILYARRGDTQSISEDEWLKSPTGTVEFLLTEAECEHGVLAVRKAADRVARLAALGESLGSFVLKPVEGTASQGKEIRAAIRSLRWDERAMGEGAAPSGIVSIGKRVAYDPVTGWFAPEATALLSPASAPRMRLLLDLGTVARNAPMGVSAPLSAGLHTRLVRWLSARGVVGSQRDAGHIEVWVADKHLPALNERPALEIVLTCVLEDPSGDTATALAALLAGAPWDYADALDATAVASHVLPRHASSAARGIARLIERGVLSRSTTGSLGAIGECLSDGCIRPVIALAIERALGHFDLFPRGYTLRAEAHLARPWELVSGTIRSATLESVARRFISYARATGLAFDLDLVRAFVVALAARPFAVLTGVSGTGKTAMALAFANFMTEGLTGGSSDRVAVVSVRPDWLDSRGLLGYLHALHGNGAYEDTAALRVMLRAMQHPSEAHFLVLDEMNLARVEHYFAEFLSAMESGAAIALHGRARDVVTTDGSRKIPPSLYVTSNLYVIGTINLDETTHALSPKVLDRAWLWEVPTASPTSLLREWMAERKIVSPATTDERKAFTEAATEDDPTRSLVLAMGRDGVGQRLDRIFESMSSHGRPFGFRVVTECLRFVHLCEREALEVSPAWRLDRAVLGKILPRLSGSRRDLEGLLRALRDVCDQSLPSASNKGIAEPTSLGYSSERLRSSSEKISELLSRLERDAFVTFAR
jgi:hypothetical protein